MKVVRWYWSIKQLPSAQGYAARYQNRFGRRLSSRALMLAAIAALATGAAVNYTGAQVMVQTGNALDANNQVGSGGSNSPIPGYVPLNPNAVGYANSATGMYSSVPRINYQVVPVTLPNGATSFARIPQLGQSSFNSSIPTSAMPLYNVNAISSGVPSSMVNSAMGQSALTSQGALVQTPVGMGGNPYSSYSVNGQAYANPAYNAPYTYNAQNPAAFLPGTGVSAYTNPEAPAVPMGSTAGVVGQISPLFGLRQVSVQQPIAGQIANPFGLTAENNKVSGQQVPEANSNSLTNLPAIPVGTSPISNSRAINGNANIIKPIRPNGQAVNGGITVHNNPGQVGGGGLYQQLLVELAGGKPSSITAPGLPGKPAMTLTDLTPKTHPNVLTIDPITGLPIAPITSQRLVGIANGNSQGPLGNTGHSSLTDMGAGGKGINGNISNALTAQLQAGQNIGMLNSLAGGTPGNFGQLMRQAEAEQKTGRFVSAIENYQSAMQLQPGNQLPIIGQANAELAAGLYQSAAYNLKFVFGRHPELTAIKYNLAALLPKTSLDAAYRQLHTMFVQKSALAAFLLAYMDYQTGRSTELTTTLRQWANWKNSGAWPILLEKAWIRASPHQGAGAARLGNP
ncbi:MAG: hypothetical protein ACP5VQ_00975 [Phycisphaerae bacterium]